MGNSRSQLQLQEEEINEITAETGFTKQQVCWIKVGAFGVENMSLLYFEVKGASRLLFGREGDNTGGLFCLEYKYKYKQSSKSTYKVRPLTRRLSTLK